MIKLTKIHKLKDSLNTTKHLGNIYILEHIKKSRGNSKLNNKIIKIFYHSFIKTKWLYNYVINAGLSKLYTLYINLLKGDINGE